MSGGVLEKPLVVGVAGDAERSPVMLFERSILNRFVPARPNESSASSVSSELRGFVVDTVEGERGRVPAPVNSPRNADTGPLGERETETERCDALELSTSGGNEDDVGDGDASMPCARIESITSRSPRGSTALKLGDTTPRPARTDLWLSTACLTAAIHACASTTSTMCSTICSPPALPTLTTPRRPATSSSATNT